MALDAPVPATPTYATADDVAVIRRERPYSEHEPRGRPTLAQVKALILDIEDEIDRRTRHAWRERKVTEEYHDLADLSVDFYGWIRAPLRHRAVRTLSTGSGHKLEVRSGGTWEDYLVTRTEGLGGQYWVQGDLGFLHIRRRYLPVLADAVRVTYSYGESSVAGAIKRATVLFAAAALEDTTGRASHDAGDFTSTPDRARGWREQAEQIIANFCDIGVLM